MMASITRYGNTGFPLWLGVSTETKPLTLGEGAYAIETDNLGNLFRFLGGGWCQINTGGEAHVVVKSTDIIAPSENVFYYPFILDATTAATLTIPDTEQYTSMSVYHSGGGAATIAIEGDLTELQTGTFVALTASLAASTEDKQTGMHYSQIKFTSDALGAGSIAGLAVLRGG